VLAYEAHLIGLQEWINLRVDGTRLRTTVAARFSTMPSREWKHPYMNHVLDKNALKKLITDCYRKYGNAATAEFLDAIKALGFHYATQSGTTVSISDVVVPQAKYDLLDKAQSEVDELHSLFGKGSSRKKNAIRRRSKSGQKTSDDVTHAMQTAQNPLNPVFMMATSGARVDRPGKAARRYAGTDVRSVGSHSGDPVKASLKEGLNRSRVLHLDARCT